MGTPDDNSNLGGDVAKCGSPSFSYAPESHVTGDKQEKEAATLDRCSRRQRGLVFHVRFRACLYWFRVF